MIPGVHADVFPQAEPIGWFHVSPCLRFIITIIITRGCLRSSRSRANAARLRARADGRCSVDTARRYCSKPALVCGGSRANPADPANGFADLNAGPLPLKDHACDKGCKHSAHVKTRNMVPLHSRITASQPHSFFWTVPWDFTLAPAGGYTHFSNRAPQLSHVNAAAN